MPRRNINAKWVHRSMRSEPEPEGGKPSAKTPEDLEALARDLVRRGLRSPAIVIGRPR